jgi:phospholipase A1
MKLFFIFPLFFLLLHAEITYDDAYFEYKKGEYKKSLAMFTKLAKTEQDYDAAYILGYMYEHGEGCSVDLKKSHKWYQYSSHGYYWQRKIDPTRNIDKEHARLYKTIDEMGDKETQMTIRQYAEGLYNVKAYKANYFLPMSYRISGKYADVNEHTAKNIETEFQVSLKYDFAANILGLHGIYTAAYTQKSYWQLYEESAYFRETNYNPELFVMYPLLGKGYFKYIKAFRFSLEHQSNGRGGEYERSWNYVTAGAYFQTGLLFTEVKFWYRLSDAIDYNPDLLDYLGDGSVRFMLPYKENLFKLKLRNVFSSKRAIKLTYTYPITRSDDLFLYIKAFSGYGESLIDYNHDIQKIGIGFSISR